MNCVSSDQPPWDWKLSASTSRRSAAMTGAPASRVNARARRRFIKDEKVKARASFRNRTGSERSFQSEGDRDPIIIALEATRIRRRVWAISLGDEGYAGDVACADKKADRLGEAILAVQV